MGGRGVEVDVVAALPTPLEEDPGPGVVGRAVSARPCCGKPGLFSIGNGEQLPLLILPYVDGIEIRMLRDDGWGRGIIISTC